VVAANADGTMRVVRKGTNGFTCMADAPATPGPDPMCADSNAMGWISAWLGHKEPPAKAGFMYMLEGGTDASNTDPYATAPTAAGAALSALRMMSSSVALAGNPIAMPVLVAAGAPVAVVVLVVVEVSFVAVLEAGLLQAASSSGAAMIKEAKATALPMTTSLSWGEMPWTDR
jgi:hypothetical protein